MKIFVWLILCLIWGTTWIFIKIGLEDLPPITLQPRQILALHIDPGTADKGIAARDAKNCFTMEADQR